MPFFLSALLARQRVTHLLSPPATPRYNGALEASNGSIKTRALHIAAAAGRFDAWTCDDVEAARLEANAQARPRGIHGPVPDQLWEAFHDSRRLELSDDELKDVADELDRMRRDRQPVCWQWQDARPDPVPVDPSSDR